MSNSDLYSKSSKISLTSCCPQTSVKIFSLNIYSQTAVQLCGVVSCMRLMAFVHIHLLFSIHSFICWMKTSVSSLDQTREPFLLYVGHYT